MQLAELEKEADQLIVLKKLEGYVETLHDFKFKAMGGVSGLVCLPNRVAELDRRTDWNFRELASEEFFFCHDDLIPRIV